MFTKIALSFPLLDETTQLGSTIIRWQHFLSRCKNCQVAEINGAIMSSARFHVLGARSTPLCSWRWIFIFLTKKYTSRNIECGRNFNPTDILRAVRIVLPFTSAHRTPTFLTEALGWSWISLSIQHLFVLDSEGKYGLLRAIWRSRLLDLIFEHSKFLDFSPHTPIVLHLITRLSWPAQHLRARPYSVDRPRLLVMNQAIK
jgi:hypothetical protein